MKQLLFKRLTLHNLKKTISTLVCWFLIATIITGAIMILGPPIECVDCVIDPLSFVYVFFIGSGTILSAYLLIRFKRIFDIMTFLFFVLSICCFFLQLWIKYNNIKCSKFFFCLMDDEKKYCKQLLHYVLCVLCGKSFLLSFPNWGFQVYKKKRYLFFMGNKKGGKYSAPTQLFRIKLFFNL